MIWRTGEIGEPVLTDREIARVQRAESGDMRKPAPVDLRGILVAALALSLASAFGFLALPYLGLVNIAMLYVLASAVAASRTGYRESLGTALVGAIAFNFFFVPPRFTFAVSNVSYLVTLLTMLVVSVLVSSLASRLRENLSGIAERERATAALYDLVRGLNGTGDREEMARLVVAKAESLLGVPAVVVAPKSGDVPEVLAGSSDAFEIGVREIGAAAWTIERGLPAGHHTDTLAGARGGYLPLLGGERALGALGVEWPEDSPPSTSARHLAEAVAAALAGAFERLRLAEASREAERRTEGERLRGDLLSSVSHDLRTPLAAIAGSASGLLEGAALEARHESLARNILTETERMNRLIANLLDMARAESGGPALNLDWQSLEEIIGAAVIRTEGQFETQIGVSLALDLPLLRLDAPLVEQALINLLENAARHAGTGARVQISARRHGVDAVELSVSDDGPGLRPDEAEAIWTKFRRREGGGGVGLGLAIVRAVAVAHGGQAAARTRPQGGAEFTLTLPLLLESRG